MMTETKLEPKPLKTAIEQIFLNLEDPERARKTALVDDWPKIIGGYFAKHTKPSFIKGERVMVRVDDSTMACELSNRYKHTVLKRLQNQFGEEKVKDVRFIVGELR